MGSTYGAWSSPIYQKTSLIILGLLFFSSFVVFFFRKKSFYFSVSWASLKSWIFVAPILFGLFGFPSPWPLISLTVIALLGAKIFFQLMGMFHRSIFVLLTYIGIIFLSFSIEFSRLDYYNFIPMAVLGGSCLIPLLRNSYHKMIQYISLTNLAFVFLGWSFMHTGLILKFENGIYQLMYLIILTEFCDNTNLAIYRYTGGTKLFSGIDHRRTWRSTLISFIITLFVASAMRFLLPDSSEKYWLMAGLVASIGGIFGDMVMTVIRKDAGVKTVGPFILGRGDFLHRMDRLIFVAPIYYYIMSYLPNINL